MKKSSLPESQYVQRSIKQYNWKCKWVIVCMGPWSARSLSCVIFYREIFNQGTDNGWKSRWDHRSWSKGTMRGLCLNKLGIWLYRFQILKDSFRVWLTVNFLILCGCPLLASRIHPPSFPTDFAPRNWQMWPGGSGFACSLVSGLAIKSAGWSSGAESQWSWCWFSWFSSCHGMEQIDIGQVPLPTGCTGVF